MTNRDKRLREMIREVRQFNLASGTRDQNHSRFIAEAEQHLRRSEDPLEVLEFLDAVACSPFAARDRPKEALKEVGNWLGARLRRDPSLSRDALAYELAWLRRLVVIHQNDSVASDNRPRPRDPVDAALTFRRDIATIKKMRSSNENLPVRAAGGTRPEAPVHIAPSELPESFEAQFSDVRAAREARRSASQRQKKNKPKKTTFLSLRPTSLDLDALAKGLQCTLDTEGCAKVFEAMHQSGGDACCFWVSEIRREGEALTVGRIDLEGPSQSEQAPLP